MPITAATWICKAGLEERLALPHLACIALDGRADLDEERAGGREISLKVLWRAPLPEEQISAPLEPWRLGIRSLSWTMISFVNPARQLPI